MAKGPRKGTFQKGSPSINDLRKRKKADAKHKAAEKAYRELSFFAETSGLKGPEIQGGRPGSNRTH
jgi:hypothetical protein